VKKLKIFFYTLFILDILAGCAVAIATSIFAGIITAVVLLSLNVTGYIVILKVGKVSKNGKR
jgi:hypothetical protein